MRELLVSAGLLAIVFTCAIFGAVL